MSPARTDSRLRLVTLPQLLLLCALFLPGLAYGYGEQAPLNIELLRPAPGENRIFSVDLARVSERTTWTPQATLHYADQPLVLVCQGQCPPRNQVSLIAHRVTLDAAIAVSLAGRLQLALSLPVVLYQYSDPEIMNGQGPMAGATGLSAPLGNAAGIGDAVLHAKVAFLPRSWVVGLGVDGALSLPTGDGNSFFGTRLPSFTVRLLGHVRYQRLMLALNLGALLAKSEAVLELPSGTALTYSLGGQVRILGDGMEVSPLYLLAEVYGLAYTRFAPATDFPTEFLLAIKAEPGKWSVLAGLGSTIFPGAGTPNVRGFLGFGYSR